MVYPLSRPGTEDISAQGIKRVKSSSHMGHVN
ncbi:hypothetical protein HY3_01100 [Hyphomonas pacifica]|uniref:Uncharacterized protein n=1 Tax=Hyphomonas pacifica TaxID=1280941 RepID=A0A8B2PPL7_9PROT|nr:hypothetical protein HY3_01100 [Hyphomonas pacifica]